jgi:hypothetical protein
MTQIESEAVALGTEIPDRRYVTTGGAVYDCEQVTVSANSITTGIAGATNDPTQTNVGPCAPGWTVAVELAIVRSAAEAPVGRRGNEPPSVDCIEADTAVAGADAAILTQAIESIAGPGWDQFGQVPASVQFGEVQGGLTAVVMTVSLNTWALAPAP